MEDNYLPSKASHKDLPDDRRTGIAPGNKQQLMMQAIFIASGKQLITSTSIITLYPSNTGLPESVSLSVNTLMLPGTLTR